MESTKIEQATFAGGCFWCMVAPFDELPGIIDVVSGYTGGHTQHPTYEQVCSETTGHVEAVKITYDADILDYNKLLALFWQQIDPTDSGGQFHDRGTSYTTAIFYHTEEQKKQAEQSKQALEKSGRFRASIVTPILPACPFYLAEDDHQRYYAKQPAPYKRYRQASGRETFIAAHWKENAYCSTNLQQRLTPLQYEVTQNNGTEPAFHNEYWNHTEPGIYVDIVSGKPLFSSKDKFDSGTGWPSFSRPIRHYSVIEKTDRSHGMSRTEVRSKGTNCHLGHVFNDGIGENSQRYCINSAALRFVHKNQLVNEGYEEFLPLFS